MALGILAGIGTGLGLVGKTVADSINKKNKGGSSGSKITTGGSRVEKKTGGGSAGGSYGKDDFGNTDWSKAWDEAVSRGAGYDELSQIAQNRKTKVQSQSSINPAYNKYYDDEKQLEMYHYLSQIKPSQPDSGPQYGSLDEYRDSMGYDKVSAAEQAAIDAYIKQTVNGLEGQKSGITQSADEAARQAYVSYMQSQATLPQALAASGYSGGMADSQRIALDANLQNAQKDILLNRDNALNDVDTAIQQAKLEGSIQGAQSQAQLGRDAISAYQQYIQQQNALQNQDFWTKYGYDWQGGQNAEDRAFKAWQMGQETQQQNQAGKAQALASVGNFSGYAALWGLSDEETQALVDAYAEEKQQTQTQAVRDLADWFAQYGDFTGLEGLGVNTDYLHKQQELELKPKGTNGGSGTVLNTPNEYDQMVARFNSGDHGQDVIGYLMQNPYRSFTMEELEEAGYAPTGLGSGAMETAIQQGYTPNIYDLGYGPLTDESYQKLIAAGMIQVMELGGRYFYKRVDQPFQQGLDPIGVQRRGLQ